MSTTIRLARTGRKNLPAYKIVVANTRSKRNGFFLDVLGFFNPSEKTDAFKIDKDKLKLWQSQGSLITDAVKNLIDGNYNYVLYPSAKKLKQAEKKAARVKPTE